MRSRGEHTRNRSGSRFRWAVMLAVALVVSVPLDPDAGADALQTHEPAARAKPGARSFVPLFAQIGVVPPPGTPAEVAETLSQYYEHVHGETSDPRKFTLKNSKIGAELLRRGVWVSQYRNGSYSSQASETTDPLFGEAADLEATDARILNAFWPGWRSDRLPAPAPGRETAVLTAPLSATETTIKIAAVPRSRRPPDTPATWPFMESKWVPDPDAFSWSTSRYVSWLRIGGEMMKIVSPPTASDGRVTLEVVRGLWNTDPAAHETGSKVLSPIYIGSDGLEGYPARNSASDELRYSYKFWKPAGYRWLADRVLETIGNGLPAAEDGRLVHYDTVWLDVSTCNQYNLADASGHYVTSWNPSADALMTPDTWGKFQRWKLNGRRNRGGGLRDLVRHEDPTREVRFNGNSFNKWGSSCDDSLMSEFNAGSLEHWIKREFRKSLKASFAYQAADRRVLYWVRWDEPPLPSRSVEAFQRYGYAAYLMTYDPDARLPRFGMNWRWSPPPPLFRVDGDPATNGNFGTPRRATSFKDIRTDTKHLYRRRFENGRIYINTSHKPVTLRFKRPLVRIGLGPALDETKEVTKVRIRPKDAAFLRKIQR